MTFWAYVLHCKDGAFYTGHTDNLEHRIAQHESGLISGFTADRLPVALVWSQDFPTRLEALEAERRIKGWSRAKKMALIRGDLDRLSAFAKKKISPSTSSGRTEEGDREVRDTQSKPSPRPVRPEPVERPLLLSLNYHPDTPPLAEISLSVEVSRRPAGESGLGLRYIVRGDLDAVVLPTAQSPQRGHDLWLHTCFEAFVRVPGEEGYLEFNFAPSCQWAMYRLDGYRQGLREVHDLPVPRMGEPQVGPAFELAPVIHPDLSRGAMLALTAVIEEVDGTISYWSLRHPLGKPDFHHPDCFALRLEAPQGA